MLVIAQQVNSMLTAPEAAPLHLFRHSTEDVGGLVEGGFQLGVRQVAEQDSTPL
jgi:hypothetical protein